jgi:hypothetical protein
MSNSPKLSAEKSLLVGPTDPAHKIPGPSPDLPGIAAINGPLIVGGISDGYVSERYTRSMISVLPASEEVENNPLSQSGEFFGPLADAITISKQGNPAAGSGNRYDGVGIRVNANAHKIEGGEFIQILCDKNIEIESKTKVIGIGPLFNIQNRQFRVDGVSTFNRQVKINAVLTLANCGNVAKRIDRADRLPSSDEKLKTNITPIENALDKVLSLNGVEFDFLDEKNYGYLGKHQLGVVAQQVETVVPELVTTNSDGYKGVSYQHLTALLIEAMKEQQKEIEELKKIIKEK